ncbi:restriction endonuclease [Senegalia sp. (in: firmicutes)]|uniref:restriction endonuclease n=1 Tax=Senegalia sp. (in: firmicutes) TaxID=1924098 RepID=UPI003F9505B0
MDIKTIIKKYKLKSFYISKTRNKKTLFAREMDRIFLSILVFVILNLLFIFRWDNLYFSIILSLIFSILIYFILRIKEKKDMKKAKEITIEKIAEEIIYNDLLNRSMEKFQEFFISLFEGLGFDTKEDYKNDEIYMEIYKSDIKIGVSLLQYSMDYSVNESIIRNFFIKLKKNNINKGIIISTSNFTSESIDLVNRLEKYKKIDLINMKDIMCLTKKTKLFPKEKEIENYILNKINIKTKTIKKEVKSIISTDNWSKYLITSIAILIFGQFTVLHIYYSIISIILFSLASVSLIKKIIYCFYGNKNEQTKYSYDFIYKD